MNSSQFILMGALFVAVLTVAGVLGWTALTHHPVITLSLFSIIAVVQAVRIHLERPSRQFRTKWFLFWFENQWLKLVLLFVAMWLAIKYLL